MKTCWPAPAKLNLFLSIIGRRADGYHDLQTLFQFLDYGDTLTIYPTTSSAIQLSSALERVTLEENLIYRAAKLLANQALADNRLTTYHGAIISCEKRIPMGGGLGGGSSNAATTLVALNYLWNTGYRFTELAQLGLQLGADVPVFVQGVAAFAEGVGERLTPVQPAEKWYIVIHPGVMVATPVVFNDPELTRNSPYRSYSELLEMTWYNDCEAVVRKRFRKVDESLKWLLEYAPSRLTGTGACVFAEFDTEDQARQVLDIAPTEYNGFIARGVNTSPLHQYLLE